jgi:Lipopolysaccharide kinase (Kdo/WaaP) family
MAAAIMNAVENAENAPTSAWVRVRRGRLDIYHRHRDAYWVDLALAYWEQRLEGLCAVTSSRHAVVHRGWVAPLGRPCYFKRFLLRNKCDWLKHLVRASRSMRAARQGDLMRACGFVTPQIFCVIEERRAGVVVQSAIIMEACDSAVALRDWLTHPALQQSQTPVRRRTLVTALAREVGRMHRLGIRHGDMHGGNILCQWRDATVSFVWLDNEHTRQYTILPLYERFRNLKRLSRVCTHVPLTDCARFWQTYYTTTPLSPYERDWLRQQLLALLTIRRSRKRQCQRSTPG